MKKQKRGETKKEPRTCDLQAWVGYPAFCFHLPTVSTSTGDHQRNRWCVVVAHTRFDTSTRMMMTRYLSTGGQTGGVCLRGRGTQQGPLRFGPSLQIAATSSTRTPDRFSQPMRQHRFFGLTGPRSGNRFHSQSPLLLPSRSMICPTTNSNFCTTVSDISDFLEDADADSKGHNRPHGRTFPLSLADGLTADPATSPTGDHLFCPSGYLPKVPRGDHDGDTQRPIFPQKVAELTTGGSCRSFAPS